MRNLGSFFENPFIDPRIALTRKQAFGEDTLQRIAVQNTSGQFDEMITNTLARQTALFGGITSQATLTALREARTRSVDKVMKDFTARTSRLNAFLEASGLEESEVYIEIFPQGVQGYTRDLTKDNAEIKMKTLYDAVQAHPDVVGGASVVNEYKDFYEKYQKVRDAQLAKKGEISSGSASLANAEAAWDDQMFSNLLAFAQLNRNQPENIKLYMDQQLLEPDKHHTTTETGKVRGSLSDASGHPLANVVVHVADGKVNDAHTNENGGYETYPLPVGKWILEYSKGDKKITKEVLIEEGSVLVVDVVL